jgi:hypothetical protein
MKKIKSLALLISGITVCLLASCSTVKIHSWMDPQFAGRSMGKTMVLGVADSDSLSLQYESLFVERLTELGIAANSLHASVQTTKQYTEEQLVGALKHHEYDSILVTRLLSETERQQVVNTGYYPSHYGNYWGYYSHAYTLTYNTAYVQSFLEFELETNLYDVKTEKLVWTGRKIIYDDRSDLANMKGVIKGVVKDLSKKGLL